MKEASLHDTTSFEWELYTKVTSGPAKPVAYLDLGGFPSEAAMASRFPAFR